MDPRPDIALVPVESDLDVTTVDALRRVLDGLIDGGCRRIILNMAGATYVDSAGMALVLAEIRRMRARHGLLSLTNVSDQVLSIFRRVRVVDLVPVAGTQPSGGATAEEPAAQPLWSSVVPIDGKHLSATRMSVSKLLDQTPLSPDERFDASLAAGEAMGNAIDHTDGMRASVVVTGYADRVVIEVSDCGEGFDPRLVAEREQDPCAERGRGIKLMRLLADSVDICDRPSGTGTLVRITKIAHATTD